MKIDTQDKRHSDGMTVPEGYFADFAVRMEAMLPEHQAEPVVLERSWWQRVRPYAYLAAMFAGIWCMLQMFSLMGGAPQPEATPSPVLAEALQSDSFLYDDYGMEPDAYDLYDELYAAGFKPGEQML